MTANPEPAVSRADVLREAADICDEAGAVYTSKALNDHAYAAFTLMERFQRKADEAEYVATPCSVGGCEPGGEPCATHERLMAHAEGDHELCQPDCGERPAVVSSPPTAWIDGHPQLEAIASAVYERCETGGGGIVHDDPRNIAVAALKGLLAPGDRDDEAWQPDTETQACPDPIECSHEAALGEAQQEVRRLGLMLDEYSAGASALTDKLKRARDTHRETCPLALGEVKPPAFSCSMCELLDAPAMPVREAAVAETLLPSEGPAYTPEALPMLFWDEAAGVDHHDGRVTAWLSKAVNLAQSAPAGELILRVDVAQRLRRALTTALNDAAEPAAGGAGGVADETGEGVAPVHAVPLPGSNGISACCGRPPCEFVGERVTRDLDAVTCPGPAAETGQQ